MAGLTNRCIRKPAGVSLPTIAAHRRGDMVRTKKYRLRADVRRMQFESSNPFPSLSGTVLE